jgi:hypothetical protein
LKTYYEICVNNAPRGAKCYFKFMAFIKAKSIARRGYNVSIYRVTEYLGGSMKHYERIAEWGE